MNKILTKELICVLNQLNENHRSYNKEQFITKPEFGEFIASYDKDCLIYNTISLNNVSHKVLDMYEEDNKMYADIEILEKTPAGKILLDLYNLDKIVFRPRGVVDEVLEDGNLINYELVAIDAISKDNDAFQNLI